MRKYRLNKKKFAEFVIATLTCGFMGLLMAWTFLQGCGVDLLEVFN